MSHTQIIDRWPSISEFAKDAGVSYGTAKAMRRRGSIPSEYWPKLVSGADDRSIDGVSYEALAKIAEARRSASTEAA